MTVYLDSLGFSLLELGKAVDEGDVRTQTHPEFPTLTIANYNEDVQFRKRWNKITLACRGLIFDSVTGEVVARPWEKFFNFGQMDNRIDSMAPVEVTDKMDGSLGILYQRPDGKFAIATRGSFASDQALHATELLNTLYADYLVDWVGAYWLEQNTYLFEIVYPENRIVVNYGDMDDLVLLGAVNKEYGQYYGPDAAGAQIAWPGPRTEVFKADHFVDALSLPDRPGKEGYVIRSGRNIVKMKQADYVELHRIVTNLSPRTVWERLARGERVADICAQIPDEFHSYVQSIGDDLHMKFSGIKIMATLDFKQCEYKLWNGDPDQTNISRRAWAEEIKKCENPSLLFMILDGKSIDDAIWKMIKPRGDVKSLVTDEG
jgi:RNA ligase